MTDQTKFRLNDIGKIENYFNSEINQRKSCSKKFVATFDYIDKTLIVLSAKSGGFCIISFVSVVGEPVGISRKRFTLIFSLTTGIIKILLKIKRNKKKKRGKIVMLGKSKLNSIETLVSHALMDTEISHEKFVTILKKKDKYEKMKENVKSVNEKQENMILNSVDSIT